MNPYPAHGGIQRLWRDYRNTGTAYPYIAMERAMPYRMAGKSGTAQVVGMSEDFDNDARCLNYIVTMPSLFLAAPVGKSPGALAVFVEHGEGGSSVAGHIAREVIDAYLLETVA